MIYEDDTYLALQLPDAIAEGYVAEGFVDPDERLFVIMRISSGHP